MAADEDRGGAAAPALLVPPAPSRFPIASSLADAAVGQLVIVDARGQPVTRRQLQVSNAGLWALRLAGATVVGIGWACLVSPAVGVLSGLAVLLLPLVQSRHERALRVAIAYIASDRWEQAESVLLALEGPRLPKRRRVHVQVMLALVETMLGNAQAALDRLERVQLRDAPPWISDDRFQRCQVTWVRAQALATLGRFDDAWRARDRLVREASALVGRADRPRGDYLDMLVQTTELRIAAEADKPDVLPDDDTLHRWARSALGRTKFGELLVSLAWAFDRRGDDDMARHLLAEAPSRIPRWSLDKTAPRLNAWATTTAAAWKIDLGF